MVKGLVLDGPIFNHSVSLLLAVLVILFLGEECRLDADLAELLHELSRLMHVEQDVAAAYKLPLEVDLVEVW